MQRGEVTQGWETGGAAGDRIAVHYSKNPLT